MNNAAIEISPIQLDILKELINQGVGKGATLINSMLDTHISLNVPDIFFLKFNELNAVLENKLDDNTMTSIILPFKGNFDGSANLIFPAESAVKLVSTLTGEIDDSTDMDTIRIGTLSEVGNIVINAVMGSISNQLKIHFDYTIPRFSEGDVTEILSELQNDDDTIILFAKTQFNMKDLNIIGHFLIFFKLNSFDSLLNSIDLYQDSYLK